MRIQYLYELLESTLNTFIVYIPVWAVGTVIGVLLSYVVWSVPTRVSNRCYLVLSGISFIPVTIGIPYFIRAFGLSAFVYPLLALPVALITFASCHEAYQHANKARVTLIVNYGIPKHIFFWKVIFRESIPSLKTTSRQTLSICFSIFIALDYFIEYWGGLGALVKKYYGRLAFEEINNTLMLLTIGTTAILGIVQVFLNDRAFRRWTEFRRYY